MVDLSIQARKIAAKLQTLRSPKIDPATLATMLLEAGFSAEEAVTMFAIAGAESGYRTEALNVDEKTGSEDKGLYQINDIHDPDQTRIYDPAYNISQAKEIYDRQGYTAWVGWDNKDIDAAHRDLG